VALSGAARIAYTGRVRRIPTSTPHPISPAAIEPWDFGVTWERGVVTARLLAPFQRSVTAHSWAWTAGNNGKPMPGPVVLVNVLSPESLAVYKGRMNSAWLITGQPATILNPDGPPMTASDSAALRARQNQPRVPQDTSAEPGHRA